MATTRPPSRAPAKRRLRAYVRRANLLTSLLLIFPLFLAYQLAVLALPDAHNGADLVTERLIAVLHGWGNYVLFNLGLLAVFVGLVIGLRRRQSFDPRLFVPVIFESGIYALTMGTLIVYVMTAIGIRPSVASGDSIAALSSLSVLPALVVGAQRGLFSRLVLSLGAGVHEELVFRLGMVTGFEWLFGKAMGMRRGIAVAGAFVLSSLLFSAAHHVIGGEAWHVGPFVYRFFCGLIFASLFQFRGLAVAVYTHALYDVYVMLFAAA